jgi:lipopolysaccharide/colanic/teichoic acid biosynthesis glycosyltransferase
MHMYIENDEMYVQSLAWHADEDIYLYGYFKRIFDFVLALAAVIITLPVMAVICLCVILETGGSPVYVQERLGIGGTSFRIYKIRSMYTNAEASGPRLAEADDSRITQVGRFIRKTRLDELPQLFNILKGDMSFVGPRPERFHFTRMFMEQIPGFAGRLKVKPGLTGLAQIMGGYDITPSEKLKLDMEYIRSRSLWFDIKILIKTIPVALNCKGAR